MDSSNDLLENEILIQTKEGVVCLTITDALSSNLNLSAEDLETVAQQLILRDGLHSKFKTIRHSSDATIDSDEPNSDCSAFTTATTTNSLEFTEPFLQDKISLTSKSDSDVSSNLIATIPLISSNVAKSVDLLDGTSKPPQKRRGGWPKGRKRKPELLHLPPKAPATGYTLFLNDMRKQFKDTQLPFHEITRIFGNRWSGLSLERKKPYLDRAEEDKRRYREELRIYRQSGAYQMYLAKKRRKRVQNNVLSESDMDATDDIDDEDNEELYCRTCDQWFHNLHNKREHLQGRQHMQAVVGDMNIELGLGQNSSSNKINLNAASLENESVSESIAHLISVIAKREKEIKALHRRTEEAKAANEALSQQLHSLNERESELKKELDLIQDSEKNIEANVFKLWQVPSLFITTDLNSSYLEISEYLTDE